MAASELASAEEAVEAAAPAAAGQAIAEFLSRRGEAYTVDTRYCDRFGLNATSNPNGWLRRR